MLIRPITPKDDPLAISRIYEESWKFAYKGIIPQAYLDKIPAGHWAAHINDPHMNSAVMEKDNTLIGSSSYCASRYPAFQGFGEIVSIYLLPEYIGKGYGKKLLDFVMMQLTQQGYSSIFLWVLEENKKARTFYESSGLILGDISTTTVIEGKELREVPYLYLPDRSGPK
ncbi:MAG: GNAT family N-acetyltransferase [Firmicutes bacterium]|nr:GNAT family N-acetyltransferase [Bacillota bacterium]